MGDSRRYIENELPIERDEGESEIALQIRNHYNIQNDDRIHREIELQSMASYRHYVEFAEDAVQLERELGKLKTRLDKLKKGHCDEESMTTVIPLKTSGSGEGETVDKTKTDVRNGKSHAPNGSHGIVHGKKRNSCIIS